MYPPTFNPCPSFLFTIFTLQTALHWSLLHCSVLYSCAMQRSAEQCSVLHCFLFHCTAPIFTVLQCPDLLFAMQRSAVHCCTVSYFTALQRFTLHCTAPATLSEYLLMSWSSSPRVTISGGWGNHWSQEPLLSPCTVLYCVCSLTRGQGSSRGRSPRELPKPNAGIFLNSLTRVKVKTLSNF